MIGSNVADVCFTISLTLKDRYSFYIIINTKIPSRDDYYSIKIVVVTIKDFFF
jgi:hypothetical protein